MRGTWPKPSSARSRSSHPSIFPSIDPSSTPSFTSSRPLPPTRSTRSSPSATFSPAISSKPQPENPLSGLGILVQLGPNVEPCFGGRGADQIDHDLAADQGASAPVAGDVAEHPMFDPVPLAGSE